MMMNWRKLWIEIILCTDMGDFSFLSVGYLQCKEIKINAYPNGNC